MAATLFRRSTSASVASAAPSIALPPYSEIDTANTTGASAQDIELRSISSRSVSSLPTYADITDEGFVETPSFVPTQKLQIETLGKPLIGFPFPLRPDPIPVYDVTESTDTTEAVPLYVSLRYSRGSGNCSLVRGDDDMIDHTPLCATTYRTGPGRHPKIALFPASRPGYQRPPLSPGSSSSSSSAATSPKPEPLDGRDFDFTSKSLLHRTQVLQTHLGTFEWRYAPSKARKAAGADSLLLLERVVKVALAGGKSEEQRTIVAQFVRNSETRTGGSRRSTAGNGGRLLMDLREWAETKTEVEEMRLLIVASCISMLKKEVDRRRMHQAIAISAMAGGGGA